MEKEDVVSDRIILCWNKSDLTANAAMPEVPGYPPPLSISAVTGDSLDLLTAEIEKVVWKKAGNHEDETAISERHAAMIRQTLPDLDNAMALIHDEFWELAAPGLHQAIHTLGTITGESADPDILDEIFSRFCIGK